MTGVPVTEAPAAAAAAPAAGGRRRRRPRASAILLPLGIVAVAIGAWELLAQLGSLPSYALPAPSAIVETAWTDRATLLSAASVTGAEMLIGYFAAIVVGFLLATLMVYVGVVERGVYPILVTSQCVPILAIAPLLIIWFGFGMMPKVLPVFLFCFFPIVLTTIAGMKSVESDMLMLMRSLGLGRWQTFRRVRLPACLPSMFTGLKQAAVYSAIGAVTAEWVGAENGLGQVMITSSSFLQTNLVFAAILVLTVMALILFALVNVVERYVLRWYFLTKG